jgi:cytochrome c-type biogenesis protein CcmH
MKPQVDALRRKLQQLEALHASGALGAEAYAQARAPLERELVDLVVSSDGPPEPRPSRRLQAALAVAALAVAGIGYTITGAPEHFAIVPAGPAAGTAVSVDADGQQVSDAQVAEVVDRMAKRLQEQPDDAAGWALLARAYSAMGRFHEAVPAFAKASALAPDDPYLMADHADALAAQNNGKFGPEALRLIERALELDPGNLKALALSGSAAYDRRDFATAVRQWEKVASGLDADSPMRPQVLASIAQAREAGGMPSAPPPPAARPPAAVSQAPAADAPAAAAVSGRVSVAPALAAGLDPQDTVFILARPASGPRMPLAVLRKQVKDLPTAFTLDDTMAMAPGVTISSQAQIVITARVSKSGEAMPQPGDLIGESSPVAPGARDVVVEIAQVVGR